MRAWCIVYDAAFGAPPAPSTQADCGVNRHRRRTPDDESVQSRPVCTVADNPPCAGSMIYDKGVDCPSHLCVDARLVTILVNSKLMRHGETCSNEERVLDQMAAFVDSLCSEDVVDVGETMVSECGGMKGWRHTERYALAEDMRVLCGHVASNARRCSMARLLYRLGSHLDDWLLASSNTAPRLKYGVLVVSFAPPLL